MFAPFAIEVSLTPEQEKASTPFFGATAIAATAGAGKTFTMAFAIARVARDVAGSDNEQRIWATTFTTKAAGEISERVKRVLGRN